jgi:hypothetical protein
VAASSAFACRARPRARILDLCSSAFRVPSPPGPLSHPRFTPARERGNKRRALRARRHRRGNLEWDGGAPSYQRQRSGRPPWQPRRLSRVVRALELESLIFVLLPFGSPLPLAPSPTHASHPPGRGGTRDRALRARRLRRGNLEWDGGAPSYQRQRSGRGVVGMRPDVRRMESQDDVGSRDAGLADLPRAL